MYTELLWLEQTSPVHASCGPHSVNARGNTCAPHSVSARSKSRSHSNSYQSARGAVLSRTSYLDAWRASLIKFKGYKLPAVGVRPQRKC